MAHALESLERGGSPRCEGALDALEPIDALRQQWRPKKANLVVVGDGRGKDAALGRGAWWHSRGVEKTGRMEAIWAHPRRVERTSRNWPSQGVGGRGMAFRPQEEIVHCIGYDELVLGLSPADVNPSELIVWLGRRRAFSQRFGTAAGLPQQRVATSGLDDGSFDPGDELCWHAPDHVGWSWHVEDGWTHRPSFWGDTAKWFLRSMPPRTERADMEDAAVGRGGGRHRTTHFHRGSMKNTKSTSSLWSELVWRR